MFSVLQVEKKPEQGLFSRILETIKPRQPTVECYGFEYGAFYRIILYDYGKGPSLGQLEKLPEVVLKKVLVPESLLLNTDLPFRPFDPSPYYAVLLQNTAIDLVEGAEIPLYRRKVGVIDPQGIYQGMVFALLRHFTSAEVLTFEPKRYYNFALQMKNLLGAQVTLHQNLGGLLGSRMILSPRSYGQKEELHGITPVFSCGELKIPGSLPLVQKLDVTLPFVIGEIPSKDILGALMLEKGCKICRQKKADFGVCEGRRISKDEMRDYIV